MSITIDLDAKQLSTDKVLHMQYLPVKINGDGPANVTNYFNNYTQQQNDVRPGLLANAFRGYPLLGEKIQLPKSYKGVVLQETRKPIDELAERQLRVTGTFDNFTYWNYDKVPTKADGYRQALQALEITNMLAQPVAAVELEEELKRYNEQDKYVSTV